MTRPPDITGGDTAAQERRRGMELAERAAQQEIGALFSGAMGRNIALLWEHVAWLERQLPGMEQRKLILELGDLLPVDPPDDANGPSGDGPPQGPRAL
jgi:hypothetical protein